MALGQRTIRRKVGTMTFASLGDTQRVELKGALPIRAIGLDLSLSINHSGGNTDGTAVTDSPHTYLGPIVVTENGGRQLHAVPGDLLADILQAFWGTRPNGSALSGTGTPITANAQYELPFSQPRKFSDFPDDTMYMAAGKILVIEARLGTARGAGSSGGGFYHSDDDRTNAFVSASCSVEVEEVEGTNPGVVRGKLIPQISFFRDAAIATSTRFQRKLNTGSVYRALFAKFLAEVASGGGSFNPSSSMLNNASLETGAAGTIILSAGRQWLNRTKLFMQAETARAGLYIWDFAGMPGQTLEGFDSALVGDVSIFYDVTKPTNQGDIVTGTLEMVRAS